MHKICTKYEKKYKKYAEICKKYADICKYMPLKYAKNAQLICNAYAKTCKICNHDLHMQNMQKCTLHFGDGRRPGPGVRRPMGRARVPAPVHAHDGPQSRTRDRRLPRPRPVGDSDNRT